MTTTVDPAAKPKARFVVMYDTPSDVDAFERHYNDVHIPLAKQYPGLRRYTRSHQPGSRDRRAVLYGRDAGLGRYGCAGSRARV